MSDNDVDKWMNRIEPVMNIIGLIAGGIVLGMIISLLLTN